MAGTRTIALAVILVILSLLGAAYAASSSKPGSLPSETRPNPPSPPNDSHTTSTASHDVVAGSNFSVLATPSIVYMRAWGQGETRVRLESSNDFNATVTLSITVSPKYLTCNVSPSTISRDTESTLSCDYKPADASGTGPTNVTVTGSSGTTSSSTTITFKVAMITGMYWISIHNGPFECSSGSTADIIVNALSERDFGGRMVNFTASINPENGVKAILDPTVLRIIDGITKMTLECLKPGSYNITVRAVSDTWWQEPVYASTIVTVRGDNSPDFSLTASPTNITGKYDENITSTITITSLNHFTSAVSLSVDHSTVPVFDFQTGLARETISSSGDSVLTVKAFGGYGKLRSGTFPLTIIAVSGGKSHVLSLRLTLYGSTTVGDFWMIDSKPSLGSNIGASDNTTITFGPKDGFTGDLTLTVSVARYDAHTATSQLSNGLTCTVSPKIVVTGSGISILTCTANSPGFYYVAVKATYRDLGSELVFDFTAG